jgi:hypothetical protein
MAILPHPPSCSTNPRGDYWAPFPLPGRCMARRGHCLVKCGVLISLQQQCHTYITSWFTQGLALLWPVNPSRQLRRTQRRAPTTTPLPPLPKRWATFTPVTITTPNSTGPYLAVLPHPPSFSTNPHGGTAAIFSFYYQSSRLHPTLPQTSPYLRAIFFHFPNTSAFFY